MQVLRWLPLQDVQFFFVRAHCSNDVIEMAGCLYRAGYMPGHFHFYSFPVSAVFSN